MINAYLIFLKINYEINFFSFVLQTNQNILFEVICLFDPNKPYFVLRSNTKSTDNQWLYLSSNGAGDMRLKPWNLPAARDPPEASAEVDPALLFRVVRPLGETN